MGTSSSYTGPAGRIALLPPWAEDLPPDKIDPADTNPDDVVATADAIPTEQLPRPPLVAWSTPKSALTRWARGNGSLSLRPILRDYVRASGGSRVAASSARAGRAATARLANFFAEGVRTGFEQAAARHGVENLLGRDAQFVLAAFIDILAPAGAQREEAIARTAMISTLSDVFALLDVEAEGLAALDALDATGISRIVALSVTNYVNARFLQELVSCIERGAISEESANRLMTQVKDYISGLVALDLGGIDVLVLDWQGPEGHAVVERIYRDAYALIGTNA